MIQVRSQRSRETKKRQQQQIKLTLFSEGDASHFQELINQRPSECLQRPRVEIFQEKYRSYEIITVSFFTIPNFVGL